MLQPPVCIRVYGMAARQFTGYDSAWEAVRLRSHQITLRVTSVPRLAGETADKLREWWKELKRVPDLRAVPTEYHYFRTPSCRFVLGARGQEIVNLWFVELGW